MTASRDSAIACAIAATVAGSVGEPPARPVGGDRGGVGVGVAGQPRDEHGVEVVELPEARAQLERHRAGTPRAAVLGPGPDALDVRVGGEEALQRLLVEHAEVVGQRPERLELAPALELDDPPLVADLEGVVERQVAVEVAEGVLRRDDQVVGVDAVEHLVVRRRVGVHVADRADADAPGPEDDGPVARARPRR